MKLLELRPPLERLTHSTSPLRHFANPFPQPALSVTVESPTRAILIFFAEAAGDRSSARTGKMPVRSVRPMVKMHRKELLEFGKIVVIRFVRVVSGLVERNGLL